MSIELGRHDPRGELRGIVRWEVPDMILVMDSAVGRYMAASQANDIDGMLATLAPDAELISPIAGSMVFRGHEDLRVVLTAIYGSLTGLQWHDTLSDGRVRVVHRRASAPHHRRRHAPRSRRRWIDPTYQASPSPLGRDHAARAQTGPRIARSPKVVQRALHTGRSTPTS